MLFRSVSVFCLLLVAYAGNAQTTMPIDNLTPAARQRMKDSINKTNTTKWRDEEPNVQYEMLGTARVFVPDTGIHTLHRRSFAQPWNRDMGNFGSPSLSMLFNPESRVGPSLGYHVFDIYRFNPDSVKFYNTHRPYSVFSYMLGSKLEQYAGIMHTQNIKPNWNFAFEYRKINSPGFYKLQRNNHDNASITTNYKSYNKHYELYAALVYNKEQHDENGGIVKYDELNSDLYGDRATIDAGYQSSGYSTTRSSVSNALRDFTAVLQHQYVFGRIDTSYNSDSTQFTCTLHRRFSVGHKMELSSEKHTFKDLTPDSTRYLSLFNHGFLNKGNGYYTAGGDSVLTVQKWFWIDNKFTVNGFIGQPDRQLAFSAGLGIRYDQFTSDPVAVLLKDSLPKTLYTTGATSGSQINNYLVAEVKKEALKQGEWEYRADTRFYYTGPSAGNFALKAIIGKQFKNNKGGFAVGFNQNLNSAPFSYTNYENRYARLFFDFTTESVTGIYATVESPRFGLSGGVRNYLIANYIYINELRQPAQYTVPFTLSQQWLRKVFRAGAFVLDNELVFQQTPENAPVNVPSVMGRHQLSLERFVFKRRLKMALGVEARYNTRYYTPGYDPTLNRFYYQHTQKIGNIPEVALFVNFKVKRFRAFIMGDNLQLLFSPNNNTALYTGAPIYNFGGSGNVNVPIYAAPDALIRFGFSWPLVN